MSNGAKLRRKVAMALLILAIIPALGCGQKLPAASDGEKADARQALLTALDAWKAGKTAALKSRTPPVKFLDDDAVQGHALVSYDLASGAVIEPHKDVQVDLVIRDRAGKQQRRKATYQIVLVPNPTVVRND